MRRALLAALLLAGCGDGEQPLQDSETAKPATVMPRMLDVAGRWAVNPTMCETGWWEFGPAEIRTAGETACKVRADERTASTATLQLSCLSEGMQSDETWKLRALDSGQLSVSRDAAPPVTLARCGGD